MKPAELPDHFPRIDVLRAYAILMVIGIHFCLSSLHLIEWRGNFRDYTGSWASQYYGMVPLTYGWMGVPLFFVLSGFCIHYACLKRGAELFQAGAFFWRRFVRLYPAYLIALFTFIIVNEVENPWKVTLSGVLSHLFLVNNLAKANFDTINGVYWSLGVEFQFYLLYPLLLWGRKKYGLSSCFVASLVLNFASFLITSWLSPHAKFQSDFYRSFPLMTWCDWVLGACVAEGFVGGKRCFDFPRIFLYLTLVLSLAAMNYRPLIAQAYLFTSAFFAVLLQEYILSKEPLNLREKRLIPIGVISYSLYLWHDPLILPIRSMYNRLLGIDHPTNELLILAYLPLTCLALFLVGGLSYYLLEVQASAILTRWGKRNSAPLLLNPVLLPAE